MLRRIIAGSARNPLLVGLGTAALILWGGYALYNMPMDAIPDLSDVQVIVFTEYPRSRRRRWWRIKSPIP